jgi:hypothetical protein
MRVSSPFDFGHGWTVRVTLVLALTVFTALTTSASAMPAGGATAVATPDAAGAKPAALKVSLSLELRCGEPGPAAIVVSLPRAWRVPKTVARTAVWIDSVHPKGVSVADHTLTLQPVARRTRCTVIAPGTIKLTFTRAAILGNPRNAGSYTIHASIGTQDFSARVTIKPA